MILVIAVSYYGADDCGNLIRSLRNQAVEDWALVIVDNSGDTGEYAKLTALASEDSRIHVLQAPTNLGYFGAAQYVYDSGRAEGAKWVVVCNTDLELSAEDSLGELMRSPADAAVIGPAIISGRNGQDQNPYMPMRPTARTVMRWRVQNATVFTAQLSVLASYARRKVAAIATSSPTSTPEYRGSDLRPKQVYGVHGSFMAFSDLYFESGGNFRLPTFLFGEENFVAEWALQSGLSVYYVPKVRVTHAEHANTGLFRSRKVSAWSRESALYWTGHYLANSFDEAAVDDGRLAR